MAHVVSIAKQVVFSFNMTEIDILNFPMKTNIKMMVNCSDKTTHPLF